MSAADVTYLFFRRDQDDDVDGSSPSIKTTRVITHAGPRNRAGSVPPAPLRGGSVPPLRSTRGGSVAPSTHAGGIGSASHTASASGLSRRGGVAQTFHRVTSGGTLTESIVPASAVGHGLPNGGPGTAGKVGMRAGMELDRRRRASLAAASLPTSELQQRSRTARESLIYRADDFLTGARPGPGFIPSHLSALPPRASNGPLTVSVTTTHSAATPRTLASLRSPISASPLGRRASISGPLTSDYRRSVTTTTTSKGDDEKQLNTGSKTNAAVLGGTFETPSKESLTGLRNRMNVAREQMSRHKLLLDRYLPFNNGPTNDVQYDVEYKVHELAARMPELDPNKRPLRDHHIHNDTDNKPFILVTPYKPLPRVQKVEVSTLPPVKSSFTPKMSDVRKRARSVLCKVKGDPRYFDF